MLKLIEGLPDGVVGIAASGSVTAEDYERVLAPAVERVLEHHPKIRFLYDIDEGFTGFTAGALWDDAKVGVQHWRAFEKCAIVTDVAWLRDAVKLFGVLLPCPVRVFQNAQMVEATAWLCV